LQYVEQVSKTKILRTCHELAQHKVDKSGFYQIDPDGEMVGSLPILAYCNFQTGETELVHDSEELIKIDHCSEISCFHHDVRYDVPESQIEALIQLSESCSQSIDFGCFLAQLSSQDQGTNFGSWIDKNGNTFKNIHGRGVTFFKHGAGGQNWGKK
jgi:hypothetical protein